MTAVAVEVINIIGSIILLGLVSQHAGISSTRQD